MTLQVFNVGGPPDCSFSNRFACRYESELPTILSDLGTILRQRDACQGPDNPDKCTPRLSPILMTRSLSDVERTR